MKKFLSLTCAFALLVGVSGCGSKADSLIKEQIKLMNDLADAIEKDDEAKAKDIQEKIKENGKKLDDLKLSDDEKKKLEEKYKGDVEKAMKRVMEAAMKKGGKFDLK